MAERAQTDREPDNRPQGRRSRDTQKFLKDCVKKFARAESAENKNRQNALDDIKFKAGDQWPESIKADRTTAKRPCLTINKMKTFVHQITNDQRQNRPAIGVSPIGDRSDPETAKMLKGLIRQIERVSNADLAYDTAFDSAVTMGWGYWRILTDYEDDDTMDQVVKIARIRNTFQVYMDPDSKEPDGSDAKWCFIADILTRDEFDEMYPGKEVAPWEEGTIGDEYKSWSTNTHVRIAEYFYIDTEEKDLVTLNSGHTGYKDELHPDIAKQVEGNPAIVQRKRTVQRKKIKWCKITSKDILEENEWVGRWIPVVKVVGDEIDIEGKVTYAGIIRDAKDPQRMYNYWRTAETELIALAPKAPWIMEEGQVEGHETRWKDANNKSFPYLLYKGTSIAGKPAPPPQRQPFAGSPDGVTKAAIAAAQDMQATTGIRFDATLQERLYDESGKALRELKRVGDLGNFHYVDNLSRSLRHTGRILIDLIPKIYDTPRIVTILREDDSEEQVKIDPTQGQAFQRDPKSKIQKLFNPKMGEYEVAVTIGPSYATKRAEAADSMMAFLKVFPQASPLVADLVAQNMDWPGATEIAARLHTMLPPAIQSKDLEKLPVEARGVVAGLQQQLQQLTQQHQQALAMLGDKQADRDVKADKVEKDYDAKMAGHMVELQKHFSGLIDGHMKQFGEHVAKLEQGMQSAKMQSSLQTQKTQEMPPEKPKEKDDFKALHERLDKLHKEIKRPRKRTPVRDKEGNITYVVDAPMREQ